MDKRWIAILIIMIIGIGCGYFIAQHSSTIGHAIADVSKSTVSMPYGFSATPVGETGLKLENKNTKETIYIEDLGSGDNTKKSFEEKFEKISKAKNNKVIENTVITTPNGIKAYTAHYNDFNKEPSKNKSIAYFYTYGHTFYTKLTGFKDIDNTEEMMIFIIDSVQPDYKKPRTSTEKESDFSVDINQIRS